ncbi:helix-turn-helix transcriptional regulator [Candidatus Bathyarchaeota archaeon]|nr:MAG: helix-turn-helix transcriptional regulator [Candidatus Bathyarchaeota archaeon]
MFYIDRISTHIRLTHPLLRERNRLLSRLMPHGMKIGAVSLWLLLLLSEKPMYGYEIIRELEKRFSGYWKPKAGTIYPALEKLEKNHLLTSRVEFREEAPDRRHYALTDAGRVELASTMVYWTRMTEILETYRETHQSIFRHRTELQKNQLSEFFTKLSESLRGRSIDLKNLFPGSETSTRISPIEPIGLKFLYAKENQKFEIHMELEWLPTQKQTSARS